MLAGSKGFWSYELSQSMEVVVIDRPAVFGMYEEQGHHLQRSYHSLEASN